jgi:hypothetical protein
MKSVGARWLVVSAFVALAPLSACSGAAESALGSTNGAIACRVDADCVNGFNCRTDANGAFCKAEDEVGTTPCGPSETCPQGQECESEHGGSVCKPHEDNGHEENADAEAGAGDDAGDQGKSKGADASAAREDNQEDAGTKEDAADVHLDGASIRCEHDEDCPQGQQCEGEHGASLCQPHRK